MSKRKVYNLYKHVAIKNELTGEDQCLYCGEFGASIEHLTPVSLANTAIGYTFHDGTLKTYNVSTTACNECNSILSAYKLFDPMMRLEAVKKKLSKRYKNYLNRTAWTDEEINELSYSLRAGIEKDQSILKRINARLDFLPPLQLIEHIRDLQDFKNIEDATFGELHQYIEEIVLDRDPITGENLAVKIPEEQAQREQEAYEALTRVER